MRKSSARRIASSRANGALSLGPITAEGKARSAQNALVHGLTANTVVLSMESREQFDALADRYFNFFQPIDPVQEDSVEELAVSKWRVRRIWNLEHSIIDAQMDLQNAELEKTFAHIDPPLRLGAAVKALHEQSNVLPNLSRYEVRHRRVYDSALNRLGYRPAPRKSPVPNEPSPINGQANP